MRAQLQELKLVARHGQRRCELESFEFDHSAQLPQKERENQTSRHSFVSNNRNSNQEQIPNKKGAMKESAGVEACREESEGLNHSGRLHSE